MVALELPTKLQDSLWRTGPRSVCSKPSTIFWRLSGVPMRRMSSESASEQNLRAGSEKVVNPVRIYGMGGGLMQLVAYGEQI